MEHSFLNRSVKALCDQAYWIPIIALYSFSKTSSSKPILLYRRTDRILKASVKSKLSKQSTSYPETVLALKAMACSSECSLNSLLLRNFLPHIAFLERSRNQVNKQTNDRSLTWMCRRGISSASSTPPCEPWCVQPALLEKEKSQRSSPRCGICIPPAKRPIRSSRSCKRHRGLYRLLIRHFDLFSNLRQASFQN